MVLNRYYIIIPISSRLPIIIIIDNYDWEYIGMIILIWLVVLTILKNMKVNGKDDIAYTMENKTCLKPLTSQCM